MSYHHLTPIERGRIDALHKQGHNIRFIAGLLSRSHLRSVVNSKEQVVTITVLKKPKISILRTDRESALKGRLTRTC